MTFSVYIKPAVLVAALFFTDAQSLQAQIARETVTINAEMAADRSLVWEQRSEATLLAPSAVQTLSQARLFVTENQTLEIVEAYTRKADGRVIPVERREIATQDGAIGPVLTFLDLKVRQVPFREVAVGDTLVLSVCYTEHEHYVPGQYSYFAEAAANGIEQSVNFTLRAPESVPIRHRAHQIAYMEAREGDAVVRRWSGTFNLAPTTEKGVTDLSFRIPHFAFSTFDSYETIGRAYAEAAAQKMQITPKVKALANEITAGTSDPRAQAEAIFAWVAKNIRYVAVYFGAGRIVPNDADTVLLRGFGDCKDKAAVMGALLAAKDITSEQVLIHSGWAFTLPDPPIQQAFNHVIVYLPSFDRYVDPSSPISTFTSLPPSLAGKPVVRASAPGGVTVAKLAWTPVGTPEQNVARIEARLMISVHGMMSSESVVEGTGEFAQSLRQFVGAAEMR
jgi:transglutaminase-like putative cysteine protease